MIENTHKPYLPDVRGTLVITTEIATGSGDSSAPNKLITALRKRNPHMYIVWIICNEHENSVELVSVADEVIQVNRWCELVADVNAAAHVRDAKLVFAFPAFMQLCGTRGKPEISFLHSELKHILKHLRPNEIPPLIGLEYDYLDDIKYASISRHRDLSNFVSTGLGANSLGIFLENYGMQSRAMRIKFRAGIPFYQVMRWKDNLFKEMCQTSIKACGPKNKLIPYFMCLRFKLATPSQLASLLCNAQLKCNIFQFFEYIRKYKNLNMRLPHYIETVMRTNSFADTQALQREQAPEGRRELLWDKQNFQKPHLDIGLFHGRRSNSKHYPASVTDGFSLVPRR